MTRSSMVRQACKVMLMVALLIGLPLTGILLAGKPVELYLEFPPVTQYVEHAPFSWGVFFGLLLLLGVVLWRLAGRSFEGRGPERIYFVQVRSFPWWGWLGLGILALAWVLAWTRFSWLDAIQAHTFTPLWIGYIIVINAMVFKRTGHCMMVDRVGYFLSLFPLSAGFWWFFEYLNRFVQNWYYLGVAEFSPVEYVVHATISFSTVLPAVLGTVEYLGSFHGLDRAFRDQRPLLIPTYAPTNWVLLALAGGGLLGIGVWPDYLFPLLWISPLLVMVSVQALLGEDTIVSGVRNGDWRAIMIPAMAGLACGFFWELWNSQSLAHWEYSVPYVHGFQIFEMPLLGYAGYLPFGVECVVFVQLFSRPRASV